MRGGLCVWVGLAIGFGRAGGKWGGGEHAADFVADAFTADVGQAWGVGSDGGFGVGVEGEIESGGETDSPEQAEFVLVEAMVRIADRPEDAVVEVSTSADIVDYFAMAMNGGWIFEQSVDGEVAALRVLLGIGEFDVIGSAMVVVTPFSAEGGDFQGMPITMNEDDAEGFADVSRAAKDFSHDVGRGIGGNVIVRRFEAQKFVAHATACEIGDMPGILQVSDDTRGSLAGRRGHG